MQKKFSALCLIVLHAFVVGDSGIDPGQFMSMNLDNLFVWQKQKTAVLLSQNRRICLLQLLMDVKTIVPPPNMVFGVAKDHVWGGKRLCLARPKAMFQSVIGVPTHFLWQKTEKTSHIFAS